MLGKPASAKRVNCHSSRTPSGARRSCRPENPPRNKPDILPQPLKALVKSEPHECGPASAEAVTPDRKGARIVTAEDAFGDEQQDEYLAQGLQDGRRRQHAARKHIMTDE